MTEDTSFGQKHIARVSVTSDESIVVQKKPVTLTASIENSLDKFVTGTLLWNVRSASLRRTLRQLNDLFLSMDGKVSPASTRSQCPALSLQTSSASPWHPKATLP